MQDIEYREKLMTIMLITFSVVAVILWVLLKLRDIREARAGKELPGDKVTVLLGLFFLLSKASIRYYRDRKSYPKVVSGSENGLVELGYLRDEPLAEMTTVLPLFSIVATEFAGSGICLASTPPSMVVEILNRMRQTGDTLSFADFYNGRFLPLTPPFSKKIINLTLPLPLRPLDLHQIVASTEEAEQAAS